MSLATRREYQFSLLLPNPSVTDSSWEILMAAHWTLIAACALLHCQVATAQEGRDFRHEVVNSWDSLDKEIRTFQASIVTERSRVSQSGEKTGYKEITRLQILPERSLFEYARIEPNNEDKYETERIVINDKYYAKLQKRNPSANWILVEHKPFAPKLAVKRRNIILPWTMLANVQFTDWLLDPAVVITRLNALGGGKTRMHFELRETPGKRPVNDLMRSGYIDFDEARGFCITGFVINQRSQFSEWTESCTCAYKPSAGIPCLEEVTFDSPEIRSVKFGTSKSHTVSKYSVEYNLDLSDNEVWLSYYGLPEPFGIVRERRTPTYVWWLLAAGVFALLGIGFWILQYRRKKAVSA